MKIIKAFTHCFAKKIVQRIMILYQFILFIVLIHLLYDQDENFDPKYDCFIYMAFNVFCHIANKWGLRYFILRSHSADLKTFFVVLYMRIFLAIWCVIHVLLLPTYVLDDTDSAKFKLFIIIIADFVNQISWALYLLFRFGRQLFPRGEESVINQDFHEDSYSIVIEDLTNDTNGVSVSILIKFKI